MAFRSGILAAALALTAPLAFAICRSMSGQPLSANVPTTAQLKDMTWPQVRAAVRAGYTTVLVPTGGIEQNGAHMILGKHDYIVAWAADRIAKDAGHTLVAPVLSYVPEGDFAPATGHMRFPGTLGVTPEAFAAVLDGVARSLKAHGFTLILFLGDHGDSQPVQAAVAARLSQEWNRQGVSVASLDAYYDDSAQIKRLEAEGETSATIGQHAAIIDTSELMAIYPEGVDLRRLPEAEVAVGPTGASGAPSRASEERGRNLIAMRIAAAVAQIDALRNAR